MVLDRSCQTFGNQLISHLTENMQFDWIGAESFAGCWRLLDLEGSHFGTEVTGVRVMPLISRKKTEYLLFIYAKGRECSMHTALDDLRMGFMVYIFDLGWDSNFWGEKKGNLIKWGGKHSIPNCSEPFSEKVNSPLCESDNGSDQVLFYVDGPTMHSIWVAMRQSWTQHGHRIRGAGLSSAASSDEISYQWALSSITLPWGVVQGDGPTQEIWACIIAVLWPLPGLWRHRAWWTMEWTHKSVMVHVMNPHFPPISLQLKLQEYGLLSKLSIVWSIILL